jgi:peroxiredoxin
MKKNLLSLLVVIVIGSVIGGFLWNKYRVPPTIMESNVTFITSDGIKDLADMKGQSTIVVFYAKWCGQCMAEMKPLQAAQAKFSPQNIQIVALTDDTPEQITIVRDHFGITFAQYQLENKLKAHDVHTIPTTYILNENGQIVFEHVGVLNWSDDSFLNEVIALVNT